MRIFYLLSNLLLILQPKMLLNQSSHNPSVSLAALKMLRIHQDRSATSTFNITRQSRIRRNLLRYCANISRATCGCFAAQPIPSSHTIYACSAHYYGRHGVHVQHLKWPHESWPRIALSCRRHSNKEYVEVSPTATRFPFQSIGTDFQLITANQIM